ncbi:hypothetical protein AAGS40_02840 [Paraburkholderia sp. PREW-6R]|uniref:hypothetical protein n=1 Tax=Paraburkholderia sp. PREW-6R TaxID=3141544 RepID=UPI0031F5BCCE
MRLRTYTAITLAVFSSAAFAWQPLTYPVRSQSPYQRSIDTATCYAMANKQTKVNIAHESQLPPRQPAATRTSSTGVPSRPPLPPSSFSAAPFGTSMPADMSAPDASASAPATAAAPKPASGSTAHARGKATTTATTATGASATMATAASATAASATATSADSGASSAAMASGAQSAAVGSGTQMPPLPAPEPPMTQYWAAYGACMQARGYVVQ